jgi:hypothetical protein
LQINTPMSNKKININYFCIIIIYLLLLLPLIYTHVASFFNVTGLLVCTFCFCVIGSFFLSSLNSRHLFLPLSNTCLSFFFGALSFSIFIFISANPFFLFGLLLLFTLLILIFYRDQVDWHIEQTTPNLVAFITVIVLFILISVFDIHLQFSKDIPNMALGYPDDYYYTTLVASMRRGTIYNATYELGTPLNYYQLLSFFIPSLLADLLHISSYQALWGMSQPFYKFLAILLCYEICYFFLRHSVLRKNYWFIILSLSLPVLLLPLRPIPVSRGKAGYLFNCLGYLAPNGAIVFPGSPTLPFAIIFFLFCLLLFSKINWQSIKITPDKVFFVACLSIMMFSKFAFYASFGLFLAIIVLKRILFNKENPFNYLLYFVPALLISVILYNICVDKTTFYKYGFEYGFLVYWYAYAHHLNPHGVVNNIMIICLILLMYLEWTSIRLIGLFALVKSKVPNLKDFFVSSFISVLVVTVIALFIRMYRLNDKGDVIVDSTPDVRQFISSSFYILTIVSTIGLLYMLYGADMKKLYKKIIFTAVAIWSAISLVPLISVHFNNLQNVKCKQYDWYVENCSALKEGKYDDGLIVVNPGLVYYGTMLAGSDYGKYWSAMDRSDGNYNVSVKNEYRWTLFKDLLAHPQGKYLSQMKSEGVKYIITTPEDSSQVANIAAQFPQYVHKIMDTRWIYRID